MDTGIDVPGSGSGSGTANKKRKVVTSKVANNNNGRANSSWGLVQTLTDKKDRGKRASTPRTAAHAPATTVLTSMACSQEPPTFPLSRSRSNNSSSSSSSVTTEHLPPLQVLGTEAWRSLATTTQAAKRRTVRGGAVEDMDRATEPLVDMVREVRHDGTGPAAQRGQPGGIAEWEPLQLSRIHACRLHRTACPNLVRYRRICFSVRAPEQPHCPRYLNPFIPTFLPTHPTRPVVCLHRKSVNDRIVCLATLHHVCHALSRHACQTSCSNNNQQSAGDITR